jgi:hypothetical protein
MTDLSTIASLATAGGTLVLGVATFASVRSANKAARVAERSLRLGTRPILIPSREDDPTERVRFGDGRVLTVPGHGAGIETTDEVLYLAIAVRNGGAGLAVILGWRPEATELTAVGTPAPALDEFRRQSRDLYIPAGYSGFWQGAIRDPSDPVFAPVREHLEAGERVMVDLLYGDQEGAQRAIARFTVGLVRDGDAYGAEVVRYWNVDDPDPR